MGLDCFPISAPVYLGAFTGSSSTVRPLFTAPVACRIVSIKLMDLTGVTAHTQNYGTATVYNVGTAGSGTTSVAARATDTATTDDITAFAPWDITLSTTEADLELAAGEALAFKWTEAGTGQDLGGALVVVNYAIGTGAGN